LRPPPPLTPSPERKPRVLAASTPLSHRELAQPGKAELPATVAIPAAHFDRIRTWVKYGMSAAQVAEVYRVDVGEIERILRKTRK
jgi:hypothetical protein